jgi:hypothetical protein
MKRHKIIGNIKVGVSWFPGNKKNIAKKSREKIKYLFLNVSV